MSISNHKYLKEGQQLSEEQLLGYLNGTLPHDLQHSIEEALQEDDFLNDAVEGLAEIKDKEQISQITAQLNLRLRRQLQEKAARRQKRKFRPDRQVWVYIIVILFLAILSWMVIRQLI